MKKTLTIMIVLIIAVLLFIPSISNANVQDTDTKINDLYYRILDEDNKTVELTGVDNSDFKSKVDIPSSVEIEEKTYTVTSIGNSAFSGCSTLTSITIPDSVTSIGNSAFRGCSTLTSITIPDSVTSIGNYAFNYCYKLTSIEIPDSVTSIGDWAFNSCYTLTSITIPDSVTSIGTAAFSGCSTLTSITIPDSVTSIGNSAFSNCRCLTSITIPDSVTSIGNSAFSACDRLRSITIPDSVTQINPYTFQSCYNLENVIIPKSVQAIALNAFVNSEKLVINTYSGAYAETFAKDNNLQYRLIIKDTINEMYYRILDEDNKIVELTGVYNSDFKSKVDVPSNVEIEEKTYTVTSIGNVAFSGCSTLTSITIPDSVTSIGNYAFSGCYALTSITIPDSVTSIGDGAFFDCTALTSIEIPDSITSIGDSAFYDCTALTSIEIPDSVTSIGDVAFFDCTALTSITIPDSVTSIEWNAFYGCKELVIYTYSDAYAERFAKTQGISYKLLSITFEGINKKDEMLTNIEVGTKVSDLKNKIKTSDNICVVIEDKDGNIMDDTKTIATGTNVLIKNKETMNIIQNLNVVIYGDTNGDGKINSTDALAVIKNKLGKIKFGDAHCLEAARVTETTRSKVQIPSSADALAIIKYKLNKYDIKQDL